MRKRSKLQKKIQTSTNHRTKENVLNKIKEIENLNFNKYRKKSKRHESCCYYQEKPKILLQFVKNDSTIRAGIRPLQDEEGNLEPGNKKISELLNEQYNSVFSTPDPSMSSNV